MKKRSSHIAVRTIKFFIFFAALTLLISSTLPYNASAHKVNMFTSSSNIAPNPSFEFGEGKPDGWNIKNPDYATFTWSNSVARTGSRSICLSNIQKHPHLKPGWESDLIPFQYVTEYTAETWFYSTIESIGYVSADIIIESYDANGKWLGARGSGEPTVGQWTKIYAMPVEPDFGTAFVKLILNLDVSSDSEVLSGEVCFDDVYLSAAYEDFYDVSPNHYATPFINRLAYAGITGGCKVDPPMYCPSDFCETRRHGHFPRTRNELSRGFHTTARNRCL
jgi:hypothetical protein